MDYKKQLLIERTALVRALLGEDTEVITRVLEKYHRSVLEMGRPGQTPEDAPRDEIATYRTQPEVWDPSAREIGPSSAASGVRMDTDPALSGELRCPNCKDALYILNANRVCLSCSYKEEI